jgi:RHH-type proline utilization regulon transcriptional repressor/proline dehydrogenase/delta 1-pyrroline-5-carboxylate dehydrogenase
MSELSGIPAPVSLTSLFLIDEKTAVDTCAATLDWTPEKHLAAAAIAKELVESVRGAKSKPGAIQSFLREFSLDTDEGLALMTLAEALLRVPDAYTADLLIADKVTDARWTGPNTVDDWLVRAAGAGMALSRKTLESVVARLGAPVIRQALRRAVQFMGAQFVLGENVTDAFAAAKPFEQRGYRMSYDMLGEGARTADDADRYFSAYTKLLGDLTQSYPKGSGTRRPTVSVKLSALHPRYEYAQRDKCVPVIVERVRHLARLAANADVAMTIDAEEAARLETSLEIIRQVHDDTGLGDWDGLGLAIQAYDKRALAVINEAASWVEAHGRRLTPRLVKGAYWDSEIKLAQVNGLQDFPCYTRKSNTDLSYLACAKRMLELRDSFHCLFGTHNAYTVAAILELANGNLNRLEFQRLQGMGQALHDHVIEKYNLPVSIYAPVGPYHELLPYLVRRMLENGANSSFVNQLYDPGIPVDSVIKDPVADALSRETRRHANLKLPLDLYSPTRKNAAGMALYAPSHLRGLQHRIAHVAQAHKPVAMPIVEGEDIPTNQRRIVQNPADISHVIGEVVEAGPHLVDQAMHSLAAAFPSWAATPVKDRAAILRRFADILERDRDELMVLLGLEGGRTLPDGLSEVREAVDFCRYYAAEAEHSFNENGIPLPGPTGETNRLRLLGRGVFVCISPWNFPLAIFLGQIVAALAAGNTVLAKPAEQTPLIAHAAIKRLLEAGLPVNAIALMPGDGAVGGAAVAHGAVAGVCFTGSTEVAKIINKTLADRDGPIVPLIAETGGLNAMVVDSSALPEQVVDAALLSAFGSAGQRCSALRLLLVQDEIAPKIIDLLRGAMDMIRIGAPLDLATDVGPVIDADAKARLDDHIAILASDYQILARASLPLETATKGHFVAPVLAELPEVDTLRHEVFGPVLHLVRYNAKDLPDIIARVNASGYGLTFGLQTRINGEVDSICNAVRAGNVYINRSIIGAVVGSQPFGGMGLSGTGPKAGGPHYLPRFATEQTITVNTAATGGNLDLLKSPD